MSKINEYRAFQAEQSAALRWKEKIGARYEGGGGGRGEVVSMHVKPCVYFQPYDGATNYHDAPEPLQRYLAAEVTKDFPRLLANALAAMEAERVKLATAAAAEHAQLMKDAGLTEQPA